MNKIIVPLFVALVCLLSVAAEVNYYYKIELQYDQGEITYTTLMVIPSERALKTPGANYIAEIIGSDNRAVNITFFGIPTELLYDIADPETGEIIGGGLRILNESEATLYLPYYDNAQRINIYNLSLVKKLTIPVAELSKEAALPKIVEEGLPEVREEEVMAATPAREIVTGVLLGLGVIVVLTILLLLARRKKKA